MFKMKEKEFKIMTTCPDCGSEFKAAVTLPADPTEMAPMVRSKMKPVGSMFIYRITSDDIKIFIQNKCREISGQRDVKVDVIPCFCEKKHQNKDDIHRAYASLRVAFSSNVVEKHAELGWYGQLGESQDNIKMIPSIFNIIVSKYQYSRSVVDAWLSNYKYLEQLEERFGMTEEFIKDLRNYCSPRALKANNSTEQWIIFAAAPEKVIADMLHPAQEGAKTPTVKIQDVRQLSKDAVEFVVHVNPDAAKLKEDPTVRKLLMGNKKK